MAKGANMKVNMTADNSDLVKKAKDSKKALSDFEKVGNSALTSLGNAFGVNVGKVEQFSSALKGLGEKIAKSGKEGSATFGAMLSSISAATAGIAGLGIGAATVAFKALRSEAEAFKNTVEGANIEASTAAYIATYAQIMRDARKAVGEGVAEAASTWDKTLGATKAQAQTWLTTYVAELISGSNLLEARTKAMASTIVGAAAATPVATEAEKIANEMYQIQLEMIKQSAAWARQEREIAEYKKIAYDKTNNLVERQQALNNYVELINSRYTEEIQFKERLADLQQELNSLASSSLDDVKKENTLRVDAENTAARMQNALRETLELQQQISNASSAEAAARKKAAEAAAAEAAARASLVEFGQNAVAGTELKSALPTSATALKEEPGLAVPVHLKFDEQEVIDFTNELTSLLTSYLEGVGDMIGTLVGNLTTGENAWENFGQTALSAMGDLAISVGKIAISTGTATLGIKAALESLNGYVAIAAGVALVALGTAVKASLSNLASGSYSASSYVASTTGSSASSLGSEYQSQTMEIKVTGTLRASGNELLTVIENEQKRQYATT